MMLNAQAIREKVVQVIKEHRRPTTVGRLTVDEKGEFTNPFDCDKSRVLQETRAFNESPPNVHKCCVTLTKVLHLMAGMGETLTPKQKTDLFFGTTKLFQSNDTQLRRLMYLFIKVIKPVEAEVFIIISSLTKDMNSNVDCYRANAIRVLSQIIDSSMAGQIERYIKTAIVDTNPFVASSAIVCGLNLLKSAPEVVRRWVNEVQQCVTSRHPMVQFHALLLLHELKGSDRLAIHKLVDQLTKTNSKKSPLSECLVIRYALNILKTEREPTTQKHLLDYFESCLRHKSETVIYEAARALVDLAIFDTDGQGGSMILGTTDVSPAIKTLQVFLASPRAVLRYAAVRTLNRLSHARPVLVSRANTELEPLLGDSNRAIATLTLTTLLKTGHESSVDRLISQISTFTSEVADSSFKIDIVNAVKQLCLSYPSKHRVVMSYLSTSLRDEGCFYQKSAVVDALITISKRIPATQDAGLLHLCEFIEDCEYPSLCSQILSFLGHQAANTAKPSKYIRFVYNRLILENAQIRASGVDALSIIAMNCPALRRDIAVLLDCCLTDNDDEVRDRATMYCAAINNAVSGTTGGTNKQSRNKVDLLDDGNDEIVNDMESGASSSASTVASLEDIISTDLPISLDALCESLEEYAALDFSDESVAKFDLSAVMTQEAYSASKTAATPVTSSATANVDLLSGEAGAVKSTAQPVSLREANMLAGQQLSQTVAEIVSPKDLGKLCHSTSTTSLTEQEAEYVVSCIKHIYPNYIILEFTISNTMQDQTLHNVRISVAPSTPVHALHWEVLGCIPLEVLPYESSDSAYVVLKKLDTNAGSNVDGSMATSSGSQLMCIALPVGTFTVNVQFIAKECGDDIGFEDEYSAEDVRVLIGDYAVPRVVRTGEYRVRWDKMKSEGCLEEMSKLSLNFKTIDRAVASLIKTLNLAPCDKTEIVPTGKASHQVLLSGTILAPVQSGTTATGTASEASEENEVLARALLVMSPEHGCLLKLSILTQSRLLGSHFLSVFD
eukprot:Lankesteria_metandrocarpae@DN700_c0_g1_i1.p1